MSKQTFILRDERIKAHCLERIAQLSTEGKPWRITIQEHNEKRREAQNNLMWKWNGEIRLHIIDSTGQVFSKDELHEWMAEHWMPELEDGDYLGEPPKPVVFRGKETLPRIRTSQLSVRGMTKYLNAIDMHAADELGLVLPHPADLYYEAMGRRAA